MDALDQYATVDALEARKTEVVSRLQELDAQYGTQEFPQEVREEWNTLNAERDALVERLGHIRARAERLAEIAEEQPEPVANRLGFTPVIQPRSLQGDIYDLSTVRGNAADPESMKTEIRDRARKAIEIGRYGDGNTEDQQAAAERTLARAYDPEGILPRQFVSTGSPIYERAWRKYLARGTFAPFTNEEARALAIGTGAAGGYLLPFTLDPTIILTSNGVVNPMRAVSRVEQTAQNTWKGVTSTQGTAAYALEAAEASDNSTAFAQPVIDAKRAQYFVPFSVELDQDWDQVRSELGRLVQEAKDDLEATKFLSGTGVVEPQGLHNGATTVVTSSSTANFTLADVYAVKDAVPPRFQAIGRFLAHNTIQSKIRQLDTYGGGAFWANLRDGDQDRLVGYPIDQYSAMTSVLTTGSTIITFGDFSKYLILDRVGMGIDIIPHLFGTANNYPTGQRGLYALWRNSGTVLVVGAFRSLKTL